MAPIKDIDEKELDSKIDASIDKMYSRIDSLEKGGGTLEKRIGSRLKDFDAPDVDIDDVGDISKLRSRLSRLKDLDEDLEEKKPISGKKTIDNKPAGKRPTDMGDKPTSFAPVVTEEKGGSEPKTREEKTVGEPKEKKKKRGFFSSIKKKFPRKKEGATVKTDEVPEKMIAEIPQKPIEEKTKPHIQEEISIPVRKDPVKEIIKEEKRTKQPPKEPEKPEKTIPAPARPPPDESLLFQTSPSSGGSSSRKKTSSPAPVRPDDKKERMNLQQMVLRRREKKLIKNEERRRKMESERKKMVVVSDKLKLKKEMATANERHIIDNLAYSGVELAPIHKRLAAYLIDNVIIIILSTILMVIIPNSIGFWLLFYVLVGIIYFMVTEAIFGRGLGKKFLNLYVTNIDFEYAGFGKSFVQCFIKAMPIFNIADGIFALINPLTKQRLTNRWSSTIVINGY